MQETVGHEASLRLEAVFDSAAKVDLISESCDEESC